MKKAIYVSNPLARLAKIVTAALLLLVVSTTAVHAADKPKEGPVEVKYLGSVQGKPLFQLALNNPQGEEVALTLRDENGVVIYSDVSKDKTYSRTLQFDELDVARLRLTLTLRTKKETQTQMFEITRSTRTVEDVAVVTL